LPLFQFLLPLTFNAIFCFRIFLFAGSVHIQLVQTAILIRWCTIVLFTLFSYSFDLVYSCISCIGLCLDLMNSISTETTIQLKKSKALYPIDNFLRSIIGVIFRCGYTQLIHYDWISFKVNFPILSWAFYASKSPGGNIVAHLLTPCCTCIVLSSVAFWYVSQVIIDFFDFILAYCQSHNGIAASVSPVQSSSSVFYHRWTFRDQYLNGHLPKLLCKKYGIDIYTNASVCAALSPNITSSFYSNRSCQKNPYAHWTQLSMHSRKRCNCFTISLFYKKFLLFELSREVVKGNQIFQSLADSQLSAAQWSWTQAHVTLN